MSLLVIWIQCLGFLSRWSKLHHLQFNVYDYVHFGLIKGKPKVPMQPQLKGK